MLKYPYSKIGNLSFMIVVSCRNYVDAATARSQNLTFAAGDHFVLRSDFKKKLSVDGPGRDSVRLISNNQYTTSVIVYVLVAFIMMLT